MWKKYKVYCQKKFVSLNYFIKALFIKIKLLSYIKKKSNKNKTILILLFLFINFVFKKTNIKIALCTMGKQENLYVKEFINYYIKLGIDKIFIYDDNDINTEEISDMIDFKYKKYVKIFKTIKLKLLTQNMQFTDCYTKIKNKFDWILMVDMDEYLYIKKEKLKNYLLNPVFNKCDFIKFHWMIPNDNNHLLYENKSLFERFNGSYKKSIYIKSIIRGSIPKLKYMVHSPYISPLRNISCNNIGEKINNDKINFEYIRKINIQNAFIIHFKYKSTEEYIHKIKRGYHVWTKDYILKTSIKSYLKDNEITKEKIEYFKKELNINLKNYIKKRK